jgi:hypothetical protein
MSPIPERILNKWAEPSDQEHLSKSTVEIKRSLWPRACYKSHRLLWFRLAYRARRIITGPGESIVEDRWYDQKEFVILKLKGSH